MESHKNSIESTRDCFHIFSLIYSKDFLGKFRSSSQDFFRLRAGLPLKFILESLARFAFQVSQFSPGIYTVVSTEITPIVSPRVPVLLLEFFVGFHKDSFLTRDSEGFSRRGCLVRSSWKSRHELRKIPRRNFERNLPRSCSKFEVSGETTKEVL